MVRRTAQRLERVVWGGYRIWRDDLGVRSRSMDVILEWKPPSQCQETAKNPPGAPWDIRTGSARLPCRQA